MISFHKLKLVAMSVSQLPKKVWDAVAKFVCNKRRHALNPNVSWYHKSKAPFLSGVMDTFVKACKKYHALPSLRDVQAVLAKGLDGLTGAQKLDLLRHDLVGNDVELETPFGTRKMLYADWTASGRNLQCFNVFEKFVQKMYANSHTNDSASGRFMTDLLHESDEMVLSSVGASSKDYFPLVYGTGCSGPSYVIQQILGSHIPAASRDMVMVGLNKLMSDTATAQKDAVEGDLADSKVEAVRQLPEKIDTILKAGGMSAQNRIAAVKALCEAFAVSMKEVIDQTVTTPATFEAFLDGMGVELPEVIITPLEHHTSVAWRHGMTNTRTCELDPSGRVDYDNLRTLIQASIELKRDAKSEPKRVIVTLTAGANVSGVKTDIARVKQMIQDFRRDNEDIELILGFDYAAVGGYEPIDLRDGIVDFIIGSPHKLPGGPGSSGFAVIKKSMYDDESCIPCTGAGGGTVDMVTDRMTKFSRDPASRERNGTPGPLQNMRTALSMMMKQTLDDAIVEAEAAVVEDVVEFHQTDETLKVCTNLVQVPLKQEEQPDIEAHDRVGIFSSIVYANIGGQPIELGDGSKPLFDPAFIATLMNDLFGIQTRAGCSCAGPYGVKIFGMEGSQLQEFVTWVTEKESEDERLKGFNVLKPGWIRWNGHPTMTAEQLGFIKQAYKFCVENAYRFMPLYSVDIESGTWAMKEDALADIRLPRHSSKSEKVGYQMDQELQVEFDRSLSDAHRIAAQLPDCESSEFVSLPHVPAAFNQKLFHQSNFDGHARAKLHDKAQALSDAEQSRTCRYGRKGSFAVA